MQILAVIIFIVAVVGVSAIGLIMFSLWLGSRETHIEPIVSEGAQK